MLKGQSRNIILVDDDAVTIQVCNMVLKRTIPLAKIFSFENGLDAIDWIDDEDGALAHGDNFVLLLDLNMPVLDGWGFLDCFQMLEETVRRKFHIHILTSSVDGRDIAHAKEYDCVEGFHSKPLTIKMIEIIFAESDAS